MHILQFVYLIYQIIYKGHMLRKKHMSIRDVVVNKGHYPVSQEQSEELQQIIADRIKKVIENNEPIMSQEEVNDFIYSQSRLIKIYCLF